MDSAPRSPRAGRIATALLLLLLGGGFGVATPASAQLFIRGDANNNNSVALPDAIFILNYFYAGGAAPMVQASLDANDNGVPEISDAAYILRLLFDGGPNPPAPFPSLGADTTPPDFPSSRSANVTFELGDAQACPGNSVRVPFQLTTNMAIEALSFRVIYDPLYLTYDLIDDDPLFPLIGQAPGFIDVDASSGTLIGGIVFDLVQPSSGGLLPQSGTGIFDLLFTVAPFTTEGMLLDLTLEDDVTISPAAYNLVSALGEVERATLVHATVLAECPQLLFRRGDANEDGMVSMSDAVFLVSRLYLAGAPSECERTNDTNGDNQVDLGDIIFLLNALFAAGPNLPAPYPACGSDALAGTVVCTTYPPCP